MGDLNQILKKLIRSGAGRVKFVFAVVGLSVAMILILASVQIQSNFNELLHSKTNQDSIANFLVINKILSDRNLGLTALTEKEINDLKQQPFVESVGLLSPSRFKASIQSNSNRFPFYTDIAFEAVPNEFIDVSTKDWKWDPDSQFVPVIVPNMFLDFYNFQFSFSQNLPQLTQQVVKMIVFKINVYGPNGIISFNGRVVGFSDRISSLLVPQEFMNWGNKQFDKNLENKPSRLIIRTKDPGNPKLTSYLREKQLSTDADKTRFSRYRQVVDLVVVISGFTGIIMLVFALLIFSLFIQLTIASSKDEIILLVILGASPGQLKKFLFRYFFPANIIIIVLAFALISLLQYLSFGFLSRQHIVLSPYPSFAVFVTALVILTIIVLANKTVIKRYVAFSAKKIS